MSALKDHPLNAKTSPEFRKEIEELLSRPVIFTWAPLTSSAPRQEEKTPPEDNALPEDEPPSENEPEK
jgi:hypothetical protein